MRTHLAVSKARKEKLNECLLNLSKWAESRAAGTHDADTTLTMLKKRVQEIETQVNRAGWRATVEPYGIQGPR